MKASTMAFTTIPRRAMMRRRRIGVGADAGLLPRQSGLGGRFQCRPVSQLPKAANFDGGMPSLASRLSAIRSSLYIRCTPNQRNGSSPLPHAAVDPWEFGDLAVAVQGQISQSAARQIGGGNAGADVAACPAKAGLTIKANRCAPVAGHGDDATPGVVDGVAGGLGEMGVQDFGQATDGFGIGFAVLVGWLAYL